MIDEQKLKIINKSSMADVAYGYFSSFIEEEKNNVMNNMLNSYDANAQMDYKCYVAEFSRLTKLNNRIKKYINNGRKLEKEIYEP